MRRPFAPLTISRGILAVLVLLLIFGGVLRAQDDETLYVLPTQRDRTVNSSSLAFISDGQFIIAANMLSGTVSIINPFASRLLVEIPVGKDPRSVAVSPDSTRAAVVNRGDGTLSVIDIREQTVSSTIPVGILPYGVIMLDDVTALVSVQGTHEIAIVDTVQGQVTGRIPTLPDPAGLALWGNLLYVSHLWSGEFSLVSVPQRRVIDTISLGADIGLAQAITIDTQRGTAYLPQTRLNTQTLTPTYDTLMFPVVNIVNLRNMSAQTTTRIALDVADRPVNMPFAVAVDPVKRWLYVVNAGSNSVSVIDLTTNLAVTNYKTNANPRGLLLTRNYGTLYVHNMLDGSISVIDTASQRVNEIIPISTATLPADIFIGAQLFHSASDPRLATDSWVSCASCHFDGQTGGLVWRGLDASGAVDTPTLYQLAESLPYTHIGAWDELADMEFKIRAWMAGTGLIDGAPFPTQGDSNGGRSLDMDALGAYLLSLNAPPIPAQDPEQVARGAELFESLACNTCHVPPTFSDGQKYDVGTDGEWVTPPLRWLAYSAPYLHDGSAPTLFDLFIMPGAHRLIETQTRTDIESLIVYLLSLPQNE